MVEGGAIEGAIVGNIKEQYAFEKRLACGGFGIVYLASHKKTGKITK
jgi:hypothetical protein